VSLIIQCQAKSFSRIRIKCEANINGTDYYADTYFDKWPGANIENIQIPDAAAHAGLIERNLMSKT
jgi:hypothetical protein